MRHRPWLPSFAHHQTTEQTREVLPLRFTWHFVSFVYNPAPFRVLTLSLLTHLHTVNQISTISGSQHSHYQRTPQPPHEHIKTNEHHNLTPTPPTTMHALTLLCLVALALAHPRHIPIIHCITGDAMCLADEGVSHCVEGLWVDAECKKYEVCVEVEKRDARCARVQGT
jgi:hypothetical protein